MRRPKAPSVLPSSLDLRDILTELGWTKAEAARRMSVDPNTVYRWAAGLVEVPGPALAFLRLVRAMHRAIR